MSKASWEVAGLLRKLECRIYTLCVLDLIHSQSCPRSLDLGIILQYLLVSWFRFQACQ